MKRALLLWVLVVFGILHASAQSQTVTGKVTDATDGSPLPGVTITVKGTAKGAVTGPDGSYQLSAELNSTLVFSFVGYTSQEQKVTSGTLNVFLQADNKELSEVVVTALGIKRDKRILSYTTQEVKGDDILQAKETNFLNALQGKVAGVQITNNSGMAGSGARILIRGSSSLTGENQPLFVIDGIPIDNSQNPAGTDDPVLVGGTTPNRAIDIDPNIIESINILRGASATALYGSRAAGGAVLITTKSGQGIKGGGMRINVASSVSFDQVILPEFQTQFAQGNNGTYYDGVNNKTSSSWGPMIDTLKVNGAPVKTYNPRNDFFKTGVTTDNSVSFAGNNDKSNYMVSFSNMKQNGTVPHTDYMRNTFYVNFSTKLNDKLTATTSLTYINSSNNRLPEGNGSSSYLWTVYDAPATYNLKPATDTDGVQRVYRSGFNNPFWATQNINLHLGLERFIPNLTLVYTPLKWLTLTERIGADFYTDNRTYHEAVGSIPAPQGLMYNEEYTNKNINHDFFAQYHKAINSDFDLSVMVGNNIYSEYSTDYFQNANGLAVENFYNISNGVSLTDNATLYQRRRVSVYGQAVLDYKRMLTLTLTARNDWSSSLPIDAHSYFYPSVSGAFIFSELKGLKDSKVLNFGKLRAAYTAIGNDAAAYRTSTVYYKATVGDGLRGSIDIPFQGQNAFALNNIQGNSKLKSESIKEFEVGLETKWFDNRVNLEVDYYRKRSSNLIFTTPVSGATGFSSAVINAGDLRNNGVEVTLGVTPVRTKEVTWNINLNFSKNSGKVKALAPGVNSIQIGGFTDPGIYLVAGHSYGSLYGTQWLRDAKGNKIVDADGYYEAAGDTIIGDITPDWVGGITSDVSYKGFTLSVTVDERKGGDILNFDNYYLNYYGLTKATANRNGTTILKGVTEDGKPNTTVIKTDQNYWQFQANNAYESLVEDGTFIKLRNVTLSYAFGPKILGQHSVFKNITFSVAGRNLYMWKPHFTGSDPEIGLYGAGSNAQGFYNLVTPTTKSYNATLKLTF